jgi:hypothetical protein
MNSITALVIVFFKPTKLAGLGRTAILLASKTPSALPSNPVIPRENCDFC